MTTETNEPHKQWPLMRDPHHAVAEALAVTDGQIGLYWGSDSHRRAYWTSAIALQEALERRGWKLVPR